MVLKLIAFEVKAVISVNYDKNACEQPSMCYKALLRFEIEIRETTSILICLRLTEN